MLENIDFWKDAPVWTPETIREATKDWFKFLSFSSIETIGIKQLLSSFMKE